MGLDGEHVPLKRIETARTTLRYRDAEDYARWLEGHARKLNRGAKGPLVPALGDVARDAPPAVAYVNHGRWVADCPTDGCGGALDVAHDLPGFWCPYCLNANAGGRWRVIAWPSGRDEREIETALAARPHAANANWWPWETVDGLRLENAQHGHGRGR